MKSIKKILITGARAPTALHMGRLLKASGNAVFYADSLSKSLASLSNTCDEFITLPSPLMNYADYKSRILDVVDRYEIDIVIPTCEEVFYLGKIWQEASPMIKLYAPDFDKLRTAHDKFEFIKLVQSMGFDAPDTKLLINHEFERDITRVYKPQWSRFGKFTLIQPSFRKLKTLQPTPEVPWVSQEYVKGNEYCVYAIANEGKLLGLASYKSLYKAGLGAGICFEPIKHKFINNFVSGFVEHTKWTGQISFDLIQQANGKILPLECNPRATSGLHFFQNANAFTNAVLGGNRLVEPNVKDLLASKLAMYLYALPKSLFGEKRQAFFRTLNKCDDIIDNENDRISYLTSMYPLLEISKIAIKHRISLQEAATFDTEWNGQKIE